jgi:hypothetical protein
MTHHLHKNRRGRFQTCPEVLIYIVGAPLVAPVNHKKEANEKDF